jgi:hypothetical protein
MPPGWLTAALLVGTVAHVVVLLVVLRARGRGPTGVDPAVYQRDAGLECAGCGTLNDGGYRFCKRCVCELPSARTDGGGTTSADSRRTL